MTVPRRDFLIAGAAGVMTACASLVATPVQPDNGQLRLVLADWPDLQRPGGSARLKVGGTDTHIWVLAQNDGSFVAVSPICKHQGCTVEISADRLACPCHGSQYDRTGAVLRGPTRAPLDRFPTRRSADVLYITLEAA